jgi:FKBP-type peptidyl-prolyl cis-trans isomerase
MKNTCYSVLFIFVVFFSCCKENSPSINETRTVDPNKKESMLEANSVLVEWDKQLIENYVERRGWSMELSTTGLWYMIYNKTNGTRARQGMTATIDYRVELLDGTLCYDSDFQGTKTFKVGQGGVESGLEQGILMMREGEKAKLIMPPYLAHGLLGDENKIPPRAIIVYDVHLLDLK